MARYSREGRWVRGHIFSELGANSSHAAVAGAGNGPSFFTDDASTVVATINVTTAGTTLTVNLQTSFDGGSTWVTVGSFAAKTAISAETKAFVGVGGLCRFQWGAPTGTFAFNFDGHTK